MRLGSLLAALLPCVLSCHAAAATYQSDDVSVALPPDFEGPHVAKFDNPQAKDVSVVAYTRPHEDGTTTMIEIWSYDLHLHLGSASIEALQQAGDRYLDDFVRGVARQQTDFSMQPIRHILVDGVPFSTRHLDGVLRGRRMTGAMYCGLTESKVLCLHTQDFTAFPGDHLAQAIAAIEGLHVVHPPGRDRADAAAPR